MKCAIIIISIAVAPAFSQEKGKPLFIGKDISSTAIIRFDTLGSLHLIPLDTRIALYEKHILDLQKDFELSQAVLTELIQLRTQFDTLTVASRKPRGKRDR